MAIPSLEEIKGSVIAKEIAPFEEKIVERLETVGTVTFSENPDIDNKVVYIPFKGKELSEAGIEALIASIQAGGYTEVKVENQLEPRPDGIGSSAAPTVREKLVVVSFLLAESATPPIPDETPDPFTGNDDEETTPPAGGEDDTPPTTDSGSTTPPTQDPV